MLSCKGKAVAAAVLALGVLGGGTGHFLPGGPCRSGETPARPPDRDQLRKMLGKTVKLGGFTTIKTTFREALDSLDRGYNLPFVINERAFAAEGLENVPGFEFTNPGLAMGGPLAKVLERLLGRLPVPSGATFLIRKDHIEITTGKAVREELGLPDGPLPRLVWEHFRDTPLSEALARVADAGEVNVVLDRQVRDTAEVRVRARLDNVPVETAVGVLADMGGLGVVRRHNVFYLTTPENAERMRKKELTTEAQRAQRRQRREKERKEMKLDG